jgi:hypothetical protein
MLEEHAAPRHQRTQEQLERARRLRRELRRLQIRQARDERSVRAAGPTPKKCRRRLARGALGRAREASRRAHEAPALEHGRSGAAPALPRDRGTASRRGVQHGGVRDATAPQALARVPRAQHGRGHGAHGVAAAHRPLPRSVPSTEMRRSFSIDRIRRATVVDERALDVAESDLDEHYATAYGILGGKADKVAVLRFTPERARWVADERWHPQQEGTWLPDGSYELRIPYRESHELVMDVMRQGAGVEILSPDTLRQQIGEELLRATAQYQ